MQFKLLPQLFNYLEDEAIGIAYYENIGIYIQLK